MKTFEDVYIVFLPLTQVTFFNNFQKGRNNFLVRHFLLAAQEKFSVCPET